MSSQERVLLVEDDTALCAKLARGLAEQGGFQVSTAGTAKQVNWLLDGASAPYDILVLDERLPDGEGADVCTGLRQRGNWVPVIMLSGSAQEAYAVRSFDAGADDHLARGVSVAELVARVRVQLRAASRAASRPVAVH